MVVSIRTGVAAVLMLILAAGCGTDQDVEQGPPEGWVTDGTRWWRSGVDTSEVFRDMESLEAMRVAGSEVTYVASAEEARRMGGAQDQFARAVKQSLFPIYRNQPELVDSLFERHVAPQLAEASTAGDPEEQVERYQRRAYEVIRKHFREPRPALRLGEDVPVPYPSGLREQGVQGTVVTQVYLDEEGLPQAVKLIEGVHPVLDAIAMRATTQMRWAPAYRMRNGTWHAIPSWARFKVLFRTG